MKEVWSIIVTAYALADPRLLAALVGNCRRDLLDHVIVLNKRHLERLMKDYVRYYHDDRTHLWLAKGTPAGREAENNTGLGRKVVSMPRLGGLHHRYDLAA